MSDHPADTSSGTDAGASRRAPRLRWIVGGTVAAAVVALLACEVSGWRFLRQPLQKAVQKATGAPVEISGRFRLHLLWGPNIQMQRVYVGAAPGFGVPFLVDGTGLRADWRWLDIWRWRRGGTLRIKAVQAATLYANLVRLPDGRATWQLGQSPNPKANPDSPSSALPRVGYLNIGKGELKVEDAITKTRLAVTVTGGEGQRAGAAGSGYAITAKGQFRDLPLNLRARVGAAMALMQDDDGAADAVSVPVHVEGEGGDSRIWFDGTAAALMTSHRVSGDLRFSGPSLAAVGDPLGVTLPRTPAFELRGHIAHDAGVWQLKADPAKVGDSQLAGDFRFDTTTSPPKLSGQLRGPRLLLSDLGPAVGTPGEGVSASGKAKKPKGGKVLPDSQFDLPSLRGMDADVQVAIDLLDLGTDALAPLRQLQTHVLLQGGVLRLDDLKAVVAGGNVSGATRLDASGEPARWAANLNFNKLDLAGWITGVRKPSDGASAAVPTSGKVLKQERQQAFQGGESQPAKAYLTGELTGQLQVTGQGRSTAEILGSLNGGADATLRDGTISHLVTELAGLDIAQGLGVLIKGDRPLPLRCARVDMQVQNGVVVPRQAVFDNRDSTVRVAGHIDLRTEAMELRAVTHPKDVSPMALRAPVLVKGTLGSPSVGIEAKALAGRAAAAAALATVVAPLAALLPFVDTGSKETGDPCAPLPPMAAASAAAPRAQQQSKDAGVPAAQKPVR